MSLSSSASLPPLMISPRQLAAKLNSKQSLCILDATWFLNMPNAPVRNAYKEYLKGPRIPGALFWDVDAVSTKGDSVMNLPHMMPSGSLFAQAAAAKGISRDTHVVVYDSHGIFSAPRTAFTFSAFGHKAISVLDGGLPAWMAAGEAVDSASLETEPSLSRGTYPEPSLESGRVRSFQEMLHNTTLGSSAQIVLDARPKERFDGKIPEPRPNMASGHIPHALSMPFMSVLDKHEVNGQSFTTMKPQHELWKVVSRILGEEGMEKLRHDGSAQGSVGVTFSCGSGMTACILWLALQQLGINGAIYDESWSGWGRRAANGEAPVESTQS